MMDKGHDAILEEILTSSHPGHLCEAVCTQCGNDTFRVLTDLENYEAVIFCVECGHREVAHSG